MQDRLKYRIWGIVGSLVVFSTLALYNYIRNTPFVKRSLLLTAEFESISSLQLGSDVFFYGMEVGKVLDIYLDPVNNHIMVDFDVKSGIYLPHNTEAIAYVPNILYSARLELRFDSSDTDDFLESGDIISGSVGSYILDLKKQIDPLIGKADSMIMALFPTKDSIKQVIGSVEATISQFYRGTYSFRNDLNSNKKNISGILAQLDKLSTDLDINEQKINSTVNKLNKNLSDIKKADYPQQISSYNLDSIKIPDLNSVNAQIAKINTKIEKINILEDSIISRYLYDEAFKNNILVKLDSFKTNVTNIRIHPEENISLKKKNNQTKK